MREFSFTAVHIFASVLQLACLASTSEAAISVGRSGAGPLTFDTVPAVGDFAATAIVGGGGAGFVDTAGLDAFIIPLPVSVISNASGTLPTSATIPPNFFAYAFRWNS